MKKVLLHICCANCATVCVERLRKEGFSVYGFFYNPNISPEAEYQKRADDLLRVAGVLGLELIPPGYRPKDWEALTAGYEHAPEGGLRCKICFQMRLKEAHRVMLENNLDFFTTTLTISPYKNSKLIAELGQTIDKDRFLLRDFKKQDGFKESVDKSKDLGLYRQDYCGCVYGKNE